MSMWSNHARRHASADNLRPELISRGQSSKITAAKILTVLVQKDRPNKINSLYWIDVFFDSRNRICKIVEIGKS